MIYRALNGGKKISIGASTAVLYPFPTTALTPAEISPGPSHQNAIKYTMPSTEGTMQLTAVEPIPVVTLSYTERSQAASFPVNGSQTLEGSVPLVK